MRKAAANTQNDAYDEVRRAWVEALTFCVVHHKKCEGLNRPLKHDIPGAALEYIEVYLAEVQKLAAKPKLEADLKAMLDESRGWFA